MNLVSRDNLNVTDYQHNQATRYHLPMAKTEKISSRKLAALAVFGMRELCRCFYHKFKAQLRLSCSFLKFLFSNFNRTENLKKLCKLSKHIKQAEN